MSRSETVRLPGWILCISLCLTCAAATDSRRPALLGHRGALTYAPENTLAAFELCVRVGAGIELDLRQTLDGQLVVLHDDTVDRTTDGTGRVADLNLAQIRSMDAGSWFHPDFRGERVPTFEEVLAMTLKKERRPAIIAIDLKVTGDTAISTLVGAIARHGLFERSFIFGLSLEDASRIKRLDGRVRCAATALSAVEIRHTLKFDFVDVIWTGRQPKDVIDEVHATGKQIYFPHQ
jgi:glycerophosphoryl diester phosphodiesterase